MPENPGAGETLPNSEPERLGRYRLVRLISKGGMARVYEARRESLAGVSPRVALKVILPEHADNEDFQQLFVNEARVGSVLQHQNLVQIQDFDRDGDRFFLVMEYVEGPTFRRMFSLCKRNAMPIPPALIAEFGRQVSEGLFYAHQARSEEGKHLGMVHRDIKPSNLILNPQGVVKVLDFGVSQALWAAGHKGGIKGTWGYMSPEQAVGSNVNGASDQWGVAAVLYEMATFKPLFPSRDRGKIMEWMASDEGARRAASLSGPYRQLSSVFVRALQRDPADRYPSAQVMARALAERIPDPISVREQTLQFLSTINRFQKVVQKVGPPPPAKTGNRSNSTFQVGSIDPYQEGIPVRAGNHERPFSPGEIAPDQGADPQESRQERRSFPLKRAGLGLLFVGAVAWIGWQIGNRVPGQELTTVETTSRPLIPAAPPGTPSSSAVDEDPGFYELEPQVIVPATRPRTVAARPVPAAAPSTPQPTPSPASEPLPIDPVVKAEQQPSTEPESTMAPEEPVSPSPEDKVLVAEVESPQVAESPAVAEAVAPTPAGGEGPVAADGLGLVTISSLPKSRVFIDGSFIKHTPLFRHEMPAGRHVVQLKTDDGRETRFIVDVVQDDELRRVWHFDQGAWIEQ